MRLVKSNINTREETGTVVLLPTEPEDMYELNNLILPTDRLLASTLRKVSRQTQAGGTTVERVHTKLAIFVTKTEFDPQAGSMRVSGRVCEENAHVEMGSFHTLTLEVNRQLSLTKGDVDRGRTRWDTVAMEQLREATDLRRKAKVWAVVMQEGLANICLITEHQTLLRQRIETAVPRKRQGAGAEGHEKGLEKFFEQILTTLLRCIELPSDPGSTDAPKAPQTNGAGPNQVSTTANEAPLLLASPGFTATSFQKYLVSAAGSPPATLSTGERQLLQHLRTRTLVAHSSTGHVHALTEVLKSPLVRSRLVDTRYSRETALMERFLELVRQDDGRAWYGPREVERAVDKGAVGKGGGVLLVSDRLFRAEDVRERRRWVELVERVRKTEGGEVRILSASHESGKRLEGVGGIGAILTFPLEGLDEDDEPEDANGGGLAMAVDTS